MNPYDEVDRPVALEGFGFGTALDNIDTTGNGGVGKDELPLLKIVAAICVQHAHPENLRIEGQRTVEVPHLFGREYEPEACRQIRLGRRLFVSRGADTYAPRGEDYRQCG
jgi:hypothetical protein